MNFLCDIFLSVAAGGFWAGVNLKGNKLGVGVRMKEMESYLYIERASLYVLDRA
jgi:hypothetical protein